MSSDSEDAPDEFTAEQGIQIDQDSRKIEKENQARVAHDKKERRRLWAQRKTQKTPSKKKSVLSEEDPIIDETNEVVDGMLSDHIVKLLAAREKQVFLSDSEEEKSEVVKPRKKRAKSLGSHTIAVLNEGMARPQCLETSLEFLKQRKMQVARSTSVLNNSNQALRLLSTSGLLK